MSVKRCVILLAVVAFPTLCMAFGSGIRYEEHRSRRADRRVDSLFGADGNRILTDSLEDDTLSIEEKNRRFYDSLAAKSNRKGFTRFLHNLLVVPSTSGPTNQTPMAVTDEAMQYRPFAGMTIRSVEIVANDVFEKPVSYVEKATNAVHITTRRATIRRDMLFRVGDALDPELLVKNRQLLTSREYIYQADIIVTPSEGDPSGVDLKIVTHDRWTINVDGSVIGLTGRISGDIYDANLFGWGDKLKYKLSLDWRSGRYEGSLFEYSVPNIFGSFYNGRFVAGRTFWDTRYRAEINKRFILEKDYEAGVIYNNLKTRYYILYADPARWNIAEPVHFSSLDLWFGKSFRLPSIQSSIYGMISHTGVRFYERPYYTGEGMNPAFHNRSLSLASLGLYREKFLTANMIYGYGMTEYIATGYKAEITGGYLSGEFDSGIYGGASFRAGKFTSAGYFMGSASAGGFYDPATGRIFQAALNLKANYFTNLIKVGRTNIRQFVSFNYVKGWNRENGVEEWIRFTKESGPRGLIGHYNRGRERAVLSAETVVFTPWQPVGFRITLYGYVDAGFIGDNRSLFRNDFYSTIGIGVRLKNEMFVFGILQLNLSVALNGRGFIRNDEWILLNDGNRMQSSRYIPEQPKIVEYR